jgi:hypothetical protein
MSDKSPADRLDELLADAARTYNPPPDERDMPLDAMWTEIDPLVFGPAHRASRRMFWLGIAAALVIGVGLGRLSFSFDQLPHAPAATRVIAHRDVRADSSSRVSAAGPVSQPLDPVTSKYIGQATALLVELPTEAGARGPDRPFIQRANDLLLTTRLLLDSQAAQDPSFRNLLEDLELVLVQVVQLEKDHDHARQTELDLIQQALEQRDVLPRLRSAASEYAAD